MTRRDIFGSQARSNRSSAIRRRAEAGISPRFKIGPVLAATLVAGTVALPSRGLAQGAPASPVTTGSSSMKEESLPPGTPAPLAGTAPSAAAPPAAPAAAPTVPSTIAPTVTEAPAAAASPAPLRRTRHRKRRAHGKPPMWVMQSKVQLALQADPRFRNVRATATQPGVIVLEGQVFDKAAKAAAEQTASGVAGVNRVINVLTTETLQWLNAQIKVNQALTQAGYKLVSVKIVGNTAYLSGQVPTQLDKEKVVTIVKGAAPGVEIGTNLITWYQ